MVELGQKIFSGIFCKFLENNNVTLMLLHVTFPYLCGQDNCRMISGKLASTELPAFQHYLVEKRGS